MDTTTQAAPRFVIVRKSTGERISGYFNREYVTRDEPQRILEAAASGAQRNALAQYEVRELEEPAETPVEEPARHPAVKAANAQGMIVEAYRRVTAADGDERFAVVGRMVGGDRVGRVGTVDVNTGELRNLESIFGLGYSGGRWGAGRRSVTAVICAALEDRQAEELAR